MLDKLEHIQARRNEVEELISQPDAMSDMKRFAQLNKEYKDLAPIIEAYQEYRTLMGNIDNCKEILAIEKDPELREMARMELDELLVKQDPMEEDIRNLLIPADPQDAKNAVLEIRSGTGGDEASIFAGDLFRMYTRYAQNKGWKMEIIEDNPGTVGGYNKVVVNVMGEDVYGQMKYESGVHRVQRVPDTETMGRVHTSAATVVVLPEADEFDVELKTEDIRLDLFCASGPGGLSSLALNGRRR